MPTATVDTARVKALLDEAAEAAAGAMTSRAMNAGFVADGTEPHEFVPGEGSRAFKCRMHGLEGDILMILSAGFAAEISNGPLGNQELAVAMDPAMSRAGLVLDQAAPRALRMEQCHEVDAAVEMETVGAAWWFAASPLFAGEEHEASFCIMLDDPALLSDGDDDEDDFDSYDDESDVASYTPPEPPPPAGAIPGYGAGPGGAAVVHGDAHPLRLLHDVEMDVTVELGRTRMTVRNILGLTPGSVIELDRAAGSPVDLLVNGKLIGRGEVVVIDEEFGVRISEIIGKHDE
ncbi:MAG: flagellar motor switch protein FliN [Acidimicrobiia bacterium]